MIKVFDLVSEYNAFTDNGTKLQSGDLYWVSDDKSVHFKTNNIDGEDKVYNIGVGNDIVPTGNLNISANASSIDVAEYATVAVSVPASAVVSGTLSISSNASSIDVAEYASVDVNVPVPSGYVLPSGNLNISSNASSINVAQYETVSVSVEGGSTPSISWVNSTTAGTWGEMVTPVTAITAEVTVGKTYRIHFDGTYSSETRYLYIWGHGSDYDVEGMYGYIDPSVNNFDVTILPFIYISSEGGSTELASDFEVHIAIVDGAPETEQGATYAFRYAELPSYPAGGPTA